MLFIRYQTRVLIVLLFDAHSCGCCAGLVYRVGTATSNPRAEGNADEEYALFQLL